MNLNTAIAFSSAIIALAALGAVIWQGYIMRKHNVLSVTPRLSIQVHIGQGAPGAFRLLNMGLGPAIVENFDIEIDDQEINLSDPNSVQLLLDRLAVKITKFTLPKKGSTLQPGESDTLIEFEHSKDNEKYVKECDLQNRLRFNVTYKCMYGKKYELVRSNM